MHVSCFEPWKQQEYSNRSCTAMSFTDEAIQMAISWATSKPGYSALRPNQELVVRHFLQGSDAFVSLPTGSGKSLCYCLLPKAFNFLWQRTALRESIVIVVSPLISLMQDQVRVMIEHNETCSMIYMFLKNRLKAEKLNLLVL